LEVGNIKILEQFPDYPYCKCGTELRSVLDEYVKTVCPDCGWKGNKEKIEQSNAGDNQPASVLDTNKP